MMLARPQPDSQTQSILATAKADRVAAIAASKTVADADAKNQEEAKKVVAQHAELNKNEGKEALKAEQTADKLAKKLLTTRNNIITMKSSPDKGEVSLCSLQVSCMRCACLVHKATPFSRDEIPECLKTQAAATVTP